MRACARRWSPERNGAQRSTRRTCMMVIVVAVGVKEKMSRKRWDVLLGEEIEVKISQNKIKWVGL